MIEPGGGNGHNNRQVKFCLLYLKRLLFRPSVRFCLTEEKTLVSLDDAAEKSCGREKNQGRKGGQ
jgi:hypothetical protein